MTTIYSSNFDSDTVGTLPAGWAAKVGAWAVGTLLPVSGANSFASTSNADGDVALYTGATARADMRITTSQKLVAGGARLPSMGHVLRSDAANSNNYTIVVSDTSTAGFTIRLFKKVSGSYSQITFQSITMARAPGDTFTLTSEAIGTAIKVYAGLNAAPSGTPIATFSDSSITAAGYPGLYNAKDTVTVSMAADDIVIDDTAAAVPATTTTLTGPTSGTVSAPSSPFTVGANGTISGTVIVTPSDGGDGGTFAPTTVSISSATPTGTFTYTPASTGAKTISVTNNGSLSNAAAITYTAASAASTVSSVTVSPSTATVAGGATQTFTASVVGTNSPAQGVSWTSNAGSINSSGIFTAPASTASAQTVTVTATSTQDGTKSGTATVTVPAATGNNALTNGTSNVRFSPYNWDIQASSAKTINAGAYFKTIFGGTTCALNFDMTGIASPLPQISYRVDRFGPWISVPIAATVAITIPTDTADYANKGGHLLEVLVKSTTETQARWSTQATAVKLTGIVLDAGKTISAPPALPLKAIFYGDSITEGVRTVNMTATNDTDRNDAGQGWSMEVARILGAEVGNVGFGATGFNAAGSGGVPSLPSTYNFLYSGVARSFAISPDFIVLMHGTNDSGDVTANATTVLNGLLSATSAKIIVLRPFDGVAGGNGTAHASQLQAAIAACSAPGRCTYVNTAGFFTTANSSDSLHPYGIENITHIAPLVANAVRSVLSAAAPTVARTFAVSLDSAPSTPAANLTGLKIRCYNVDGSLAYSTDTGTSDASGNVSVVAQSTASAGAACLMTVRNADHHYSNFVTVS